MTKGTHSTATMEETRSSESARLVAGFHGVRYQVHDVLRSVAFYTEQLGFELEHQHLRNSPAFPWRTLRSS
jgi:hypothetical protein